MNPKNIHAIMTDAAYTVQVRFVTDGERTNSGKIYNYVTTIPNLKVGDFAIVMAPDFNAIEGQELKIPKTVMIVSVDDGISFDPQDTKAYNWLVQRVDFLYYDKMQLAVKAAADEVKKAQRDRMRAVFKEQLMQSLVLETTKTTTPYDETPL